MANEEPRQSFWQTLPGILTATAGVLTALTGLYLAVIQNRDAIDPSAAEPAAQTASAAETRERAPGAAANAPAANAPAANVPAANAPAPPAATSSSSGGKPWAEADAVITTRDGSKTTVRAETWRYCISVGIGITLTSGQSIAFERMRSIEFVRSDPVGTPNGRATIVVTLADGRTLNGSVDSGCGMFGYNDIGRYDVNMQDLRRIDFMR